MNMTLLHLQCINLINLRYAKANRYNNNSGPKRCHFAVHGFMIYFRANVHKSKLQHKHKNTHKKSQ